MQRPAALYCVGAGGGVDAGAGAGSDVGAGAAGVGAGSGVGAGAASVVGVVAGATIGAAGAGAGCAAAGAGVAADGVTRYAAKLPPSVSTTTVFSNATGALDTRCLATFTRATSAPVFLSKKCT